MGRAWPLGIVERAQITRSWDMSPALARRAERHVGVRSTIRCGPWWLSTRVAIFPPFPSRSRWRRSRLAALLFEGEHQTRA